MALAKEGAASENFAGYPAAGCEEIHHRRHTTSCGGPYRPKK